MENEKYIELVNQICNKNTAEAEFKINVLDKGYVRILPGWITGYGDIEIVNDARTSFNKEVSSLKEEDYRLIRYLGKHEHTSCFRGTTCKIEVYAPLMVARQWWKYIVGSHHDEEKLQDSLTNWNESSRRYITEEVEYYTPELNQWRSVPESRKQGSGSPLPDTEGQQWTDLLLARQMQSFDDYERCIEAGICPEQARLFLLAYGMYVRWRWTASLQTVCHFINQRVENSAQVEIQEYAKAVYLGVKSIWDHGVRQLLKVDVDSIVDENKDSETNQ